MVYANAVLMDVRDQVRALTEMRRVLRPTGLAAVIDDDLGTVVISPDRPELRGLVDADRLHVVARTSSPSVASRGFKRNAASSTGRPITSHMTP